MDHLEEQFEITRTAEFIHSRNFTIVALQFPDELLKDSARVASALNDKIDSLKENDSSCNGDDEEEVCLAVMADSQYGSCCVAEVEALRIGAQCVIHYGHTCLSQTSKLPALFVFGKASISISNCVENLIHHPSTTDKPVILLYGLEYSHAIPHIKEALVERSNSPGSPSKSDIYFADVRCSFMSPSEDHQALSSSCSAGDISVAVEKTSYSLGGLIWDLPKGYKMEDCLLFWIGNDNTAFANVVLQFSRCEIIRYDALEDTLVTDVSQQKRILGQRYYIVEKAKDANIVGILVGTLSVAGYRNMIRQMKDLIISAGKKPYQIIADKPNQSKLGNFLEFDAIVYVACAQTALLDSKQFMVPVITPFEATLAFTRGSQWTGDYLMEFRDVISYIPAKVMGQLEGAQYSLIKGGNVDCDGHENYEDGELALVSAAEKALQLGDNRNLGGLNNGIAKSGPEFFLRRSYRGLEADYNSVAEPYVIGKSGKATGYKNEKRELES